MPIFYWNKVQETGNLSYLIRSKSVYINKKKTSLAKELILKKVWKDLIDEYISKFGLSEEYIDIARKQKELIRLKVERAVNGDKTLTAFIKIIEQELIELQRPRKDTNFWELKGALDRAGFDIRPMETSVTEFFTHVRTLVAQNKSKEKYADNNE